MSDEVTTGRGGIAYWAGRQWAGLPTFAKIVLVPLAALLAYKCTTSMEIGEPARTKAQIDAERIAVEQRAAKDACRSHIPAIKSAYDDLMAKREYREAMRTVLKCATLLDDPDLQQRRRAADLAHFVPGINDRKESPRVRLTMIRSLSDAWPDEGAKFESLRIKLESEVASQEARDRKAAEAADKARKKREGVRIGMTAQDVLDSSWGRPESVNRTTTARGTREQWVYGGGNYLYFENGVLTAIQN